MRNKMAFGPNVSDVTKSRLYFYVPLWTTMWLSDFLVVLLKVCDPEVILKPLSSVASFVGSWTFPVLLAIIVMWATLAEFLEEKEAWYAKFSRFNQLCWRLPIVRQLRFCGWECLVLAGLNYGTYIVGMRMAQGIDNMTLADWNEALVQGAAGKVNLALMLALGQIALSIYVLMMGVIEQAVSTVEKERHPS